MHDLSHLDACSCSSSAQLRLFLTIDFVNFTYSEKMVYVFTP